MKRFTHILLAILGAFAMVSCFDENKPNYQYMPNMYEPVGYETYGEYQIFENGQSALLPVEGSIPRGWMPYDYENTTAGKELASAELKNPHPVTQENLDKGKELYDIYCAVCHGSKGDGQGILMKNEVFLGIPSYADRVVTDGNVYHVMMYGLNSMGSYASQTNELERWQITMHVQNLTAALTGGEPLTIVEPGMEVEMDGETQEAAEDTEAPESTDTDEAE